MILEEDVAFLEHFGKKGMRWGVRSTAVAKPSVPRTPEEQKVRRKKKAIVAGAALTAYVGAVYIARGLATGQWSTPASAAFRAAKNKANPAYKSARDFAKNVAKTNSNVSASTLSDAAKAAARNI